MATPLLHTYWRSSCSYRVRIILHLKRVAFDSAPVHLVRSEQLAPAYALLNPLREVPTLEIDGLVLTQSLAIAEYLDETRAEPPLLPRGADAAAARARVRAICAALACDVQPVGNLRVLRHVMASLPESATRAERDAAKDAWSVKWITAGLEGVEALVARGAGRCCEGDEPTLADAFLVPQLYNAARVGIDVAARFPTLARVAAHLEALPAFAAAHPARQPDAEVGA